MKEENIETFLNLILIEDLGMQFPKENNKRKRRYGLYQCQYCGEVLKLRQDVALSQKSCGCLKIKHNLRHHKLYAIWDAMKQRCNNKKHKSYRNYGGRGISVSSVWRKDFNAFYNWAISNGYIEGLSLDRVDNNGNYEPNNCRWVTQVTQMCNTRDICPTNTSGFRGVCWNKRENKWMAYINRNRKRVHLGYHQTALEAAKAYERYVRLNNLEHNFTPALTPEEVEALNEKTN